MHPAVKDDYGADSVRTRPLSRGKDELLVLAASRFSDLDTPDRSEITAFQQAFRAVAGLVSSKTLRSVSVSLSRQIFTPRDVALYLAMEPVEVAAPVLRNSRCITQLDMLQIIEKRGVEHAREIATRADLGPSVVRCLRRLRDMMINQNIDQNPALISELDRRKADRLFNQIEKSVEVRQEIAKNRLREAEEKEALINIFSAPPLSPAESGLVSAASRGGRLPETISRKTKSPPRESLSNRDFGIAMERSAIAKSRQGMAVLMQKKFQLTLDTCHQVFEDGTGDTLAVLLNAASLSAEQANRILLLTFPTLGLSVQNAMRSVRFYANLVPQSSLNAVNSWPKDELIPAGTHQPIHAESREPSRADRTYLPIGETPAEDQFTRVSNFSF